MTDPGFFRVMKEFFTGKSEIEKGEVANIYHANKNGEKLHEAFGALMKVLGLSRYDDNQTPETDSTKIISALDDFRNVAIEILLGQSEIKKSGRKISSSRLTKLKDIQAIINEVLSGLDEETEPEEADEVTKEEVQKTVDEAMKAVNVEEVVKKAVEPILERLEKIENARGFSNRVPEDGAVEKSANDFWGGIF